MKQVSMVDFRLDAERIIAQVQRGQSLILTRRGKPVARLEPIRSSELDAEDPFYSLGELAESGGGLSNAEMDEIIYGP